MNMEDHVREGFGGHHIGFWGSLCLVMNNIIGTGLFQLPALFQSVGWIPCIVFIVAVMVWTTQASLFLARSMQNFSGNDHFGKRLEFTDTSYYLLPRWAYLLCAFTVTGVFFAQNLTNILVTSQVMDSTILAIFGRTYAYDMGTNKGLVATSVPAGSDSVFGDEYVLSLGYAVVLIVCIPLGILNLEDNIGIQIAGCIASAICIIIWVANFCVIGLNSANVPLFGNQASAYDGYLSTILFNYGFVATIPSWLNEKHPSVKTSTVIVWAQFGATLQFFLVAIFASLALPPEAFSPPADDPSAPSPNVLSVIEAGGYGLWEVSKWMTYIFPIANILTSIPVFSIIIRYNLLQLKGVHVPVILANLIAVVLPWVVVLPFFPGNALDNLVNWSSAILFTLLNMIFPIAFFISSVRHAQAGLPAHVIDEEEDTALLSGGDSLESMLVESGVMDGAQYASLNSALIVEDRDEIRILPTFGLFKIDTATELYYSYALFVTSLILAVAAFGLQIFTTVAPSS